MSPENDGHASQGDRPEGGRVMTVKTELVQEQLVGRILGRALERSSREIPAALEIVIDDALRAITDADPESRLEADHLASSLARLGYLSRIVEGELFEPAREPMPGLGERIEDWMAREPSRPEAFKAVSRELALTEPDAKPDPGTGSWGVPGPGGHVRHFLALAAARELAADAADAEPKLPEGLRGVGDVKRCFLYGFYLRCCEEYV